MSEATTTAGAPTIVLVHGAFADGSSWSGVIERLQHQGYTVVAPANPLRGVIADSAYIASVVKQIDGPVLLVGHSYGGALITNAATDASNVVGLVYVAAFAPDTDERLGDVTASSKDSILKPRPGPARLSDGTGWGDGDRVLRRPRAPAGGLRRRPGGGGGLGRGRHPAPRRRRGVQRPSGPPAWKRLPSWAVVATDDKAAGTDIVRSMAQRAGADIVEVEGSHVIMVSQPQVVVDVIIKAARTVSSSDR
jgi:pimeloyl-ACP methyl ester carboxylesterase